MFCRAFAASQTSIGPILAELRSRKRPFPFSAINSSDPFFFAFFFAHDQLTLNRGWRRLLTLCVWRGIFAKHRTGTEPMATILTTLLSVIEWIVWGTTVLVGLWFALGIRQTAVHHVRPPMWPTLILSLALVAFPIAFLFLPFSKLHILWLVVLMWALSNIAGVGYIPFLSQALIWPAYVYARLLTSGTGLSLSSPSKKSPWAARQHAPPIRYMLKALFSPGRHSMKEQEQEIWSASLAKLFGSLGKDLAVSDNFEYIALNMALIRRALEVGYADRFSDERMLFVACGVLDTLRHIRDGHFTAQDVADAMVPADAGTCRLEGTTSIAIEDDKDKESLSFGLGDLFLNYTLQIEAMCFNAIVQHVDFSGESEHDIVLAVLAEKERIRRVLETSDEKLDASELMKGVRAGTDAFMNASEFSDYRKAVGLNP